MARWMTIIGQAVSGYLADHCSSFAAAIAYYALLSLFPLALVGVSVAAFFLDDPATQDRLIDQIMQTLPLSADARQGLEDALLSAINSRGDLSLIGLLGTAYAGSALFGAVRTGLSAVFKAEARRPLVQGKLVDLAMVAGFGVLLLLSTALTTGVTVAESSVTAWLGDRLNVAVSILLNVSSVLLPACLSCLVFVLIYRLLPRADLTWRDTLPGAIIATVGFEALKIGFAQYLAHADTFGVVYGSLGFVVIFMFFIYLSAQIMLVGAEVTYAYIRVSRGEIPVADPRYALRPGGLRARLPALIKSLFVRPPQDQDSRAVRPPPERPPHVPG